MTGPPPLALITGGTRRLGAAMAATFARAGYALALHYRRNPALDDDLAATLATCGTHWHGFAADLADPAATASLLPAVKAQFGRAPDVLVNNAALFDEGDWTALDTVQLEAMMMVNHHAPVMLATALARAARAEARRLAVVNILDQRIANPVPDQLAYALAKGALAHSTQVLARALAPHVRVNGVAPGLTIVTPDYQPGQAERLAQRMPLERLSPPDAVADAALYLARAEVVTGQVLFVDGGAHMAAMDRDFVYLDRDPPDQE